MPPVMVSHAAFSMPNQRPRLKPGLILRTFLSSAIASDARSFASKPCGTSDDATKTIYDVDLTGPVALILGAEGEGMRQLTRKTCDELVSIPMQGAVESLNVSVASGVCLYEALRQRKMPRSISCK